jgi:hypothetical protein
MFELNDLAEIGIKKNIDDDNLFLLVCDAIYSMCMSGNTSEYQKVIINAIDVGYSEEVCYLIKELWSYHSRICKRCRGE